MLCPRCQFDNPSAMRFCGQCGAPLQDAADAAERRHLTVLFCDLVGSTELSARLDPEELRDLVREYQATCARVIEQYEGHIAQYLGDGILAYFGYPTAHEDDAVRAVHAGLGIVDALRTGNEVGTRAQRPLAVRVGVHTGLVVAGEVGGGGQRERLAVGEAPNVAARLQGLAEPGHVLLSGDTFALVRGFFECDALGSRSIKGIDAPLAVYRAQRARTGASRFEALAGDSVAAMVGREAELERVRVLLHEADQGRGCTVLLSGEAGIGKSRLVQALEEQSESGRTRLVAQCSPFHRATALHPVFDLLRRILRFEDSTARDQLTRLRDWLGTCGLDDEASLALLAEHLSIPPDAGWTPLDLSMDKKRLVTLEALCRALLHADVDASPVLVVEDLHWVDPTTEQLIDLLVASAPQARRMIVLTTRSGYEKRWENGVHEIRLERLPDDQTERLVDQLTGGKPLPPELRRRVVQRTDGIPLFVEELTRMVLESAHMHERATEFELTQSLTSFAIPTSLQDSLLARLDHRPEAKGVAQLGAVLGRSFALRLLRAVSAPDDAGIEAKLETLVEAKLLSRSGDGDTAEYTFRHALIQDAAYGTLLKRTRQQHHRRVAHVLLEQFPERAQLQPELVAHHHTEAGDVEPAVNAWLAAGQQAMQRSANVEAVAHLRQGIALLETLPDAPTRWEPELKLHSTLGAALSTTMGFENEEVQAAYGRALTLCSRLGETPELFWVHWGLWGFYILRADLQQARSLGEKMMQLAQMRDDASLRMEAHFSLAWPHFFLAEFEAARHHFEDGLSLDTPDRDHANAAFTGQDVSVTLRAYLGMLLWYVGAPDRALVYVNEAIELARALNHPFSLAGALNVAAVVHQLRGEVAQTQERSRELLALSEDKGYFFHTQANVYQAWALCSLEDADAESKTQAFERAKQGIDMARAAGARSSETLGRSLLAEMEVLRGRPSEALELIKLARAAAEETQERFCEPELHRLQGEALLAQAGNGSSREQETARDAAQAAFETAVEIARRHGSLGWELRAALSRARLEQLRDVGTDAREELDALCARFEEGHDTTDFQAARALVAKR